MGMVQTRTSLEALRLVILEKCDQAGYPHQRWTLWTITMVGSQELIAHEKHLMRQALSSRKARAQTEMKYKETQKKKHSNRQLLNPGVFTFLKCIYWMKSLRYSQQQQAQKSSWITSNYANIEHRPTCLANKKPNILQFAVVSSHFRETLTASHHPVVPLFCLTNVSASYPASALTALNLRWIHSLGWNQQPLARIGTKI